MEFSKINEHGSTLVENPTDLEFSFSKIGLTPEENKFLEAAASTNQEIAEGIKMKLKKASTNQFIMRNISKFMKGHVLDFVFSYLCSCCISTYTRI